MHKKLIDKRNYKRSLCILRDAVIERKVRTPKNVPVTVFLCGANRDKNKISVRREAILEFAKENLPNTQFFLAESLLNTEQILGNESKNLLDFEKSLSEFADKIVIVLESPSAFAELGAFCHESLREKLIVINDKKYKDSESYINLGPIKAIKDASADNCVISYGMNDDGVNHVDSIGDVFHPLFELLHKPKSVIFTAVTLDCCNPGKKCNKYSAMMMHDLIYMCGPLSHRELASILETIFGKQNFKIKTHTAILQALDIVSRNDGLYRSSSDGLLFNYHRIDVDKIVSVFRNYIQRYFPNRIYGH